MKRKKKGKVKFKNLSVGAKFREVPDEWGHAFVFPLVKERPTQRGDTVCNARAGEVWFRFEDDEEVLLG